MEIFVWIFNIYEYEDPDLRFLLLLFPVCFKSPFIDFLNPKCIVPGFWFFKIFKSTKITEKMGFCQTCWKIWSFCLSFVLASAYFGRYVLKFGQLFQGWGSDIFSTDPDPAQLENNPDPTRNRNEEKNIFIF